MMPTKVAVWDIWVRIGHWAVVIAIVMQFVTGGELRWQEAHATVGLAVLGWVLFRILWGFWGAGSARFSAFVPTRVSALKISIAALMGGPPERPATHTAIGGIGALLLIGLIGLVALTGAASSDDIFFEGPLARHPRGGGA
jgi:cytochrome b